MPTDTSHKFSKCSCIVCHKEQSAKGIFTHFMHHHDPEARQAWLLKNNNAEKIKSGLETIKQSRKTRKDEEEKKYNVCPNTCKECNVSLTFEKRNNTYCSFSCRATAQNRIRKNNGWTQPAESKEQTSLSLKKFYNENPGHASKSIKKYRSFCNVCFSNCSVCNTTIIHRGKTPVRKTCSRECQIHASVGNRTYTNGRRLNIYYTTKQGDIVLLESRWELKIAETLDKLDIRWIRPKPISYTLNNVSRLYYPDFYLPDYKLYLDPKNPTCVNQSIDKMDIVQKLIPLWYGDVFQMIELLTLVRVVGFEPTTRFLAPAPKAGGINQTIRHPE